MRNKYKLIFSGKQNACENMQTDLQILNDSIEKGLAPTLRIYQWQPPAISLGRGQKENSINLEICNELSIDIVKRPTGGRAVYHQGDITYSFVINSELLKYGNNIKSSYKEISNALILAFKEMQIDDVYIASSRESYTKSQACMAISTGADLEYKGLKIAGSAQLRKNGYILQHGSILINQDFNTAARLFNVSPDILKCINVETILGQTPSTEFLCESLQKGFEKNFSCSFEQTSAAGLHMPSASRV